MLNELYEQGAGKGAYALLPPVADRPRWLVANALSKIVGKEPGERAVTSLIQACETVAGEKLTGSEIVCAIGRKARVIARPSVDNREGYALTVVPQEFEKGGLAGIRDEIRQRREERARAGAIASDASLRMLIAMEVESRLENEWAAMGEAGQFKAIDKARRELAAEHRWPRPQGSFEPLTADQKRWSEYSDAQRTKLATGRVKAALRDATAKQFEAEIVGRDRAALAAELQAKFYGDAEASAATES